MGLTWVHVGIIVLIGPVSGYSWDLDPGALFRDGTVLHAIGEGLAVAFFAILASWKKFSRTFRSVATALGVMSASAIFVHLSGGYIELHFHFFVMLAFLALYQDWTPYLLAIAYVAIHHGIVGSIAPEEVFNHTAALNAPWTWAGIHAFFIFWSCVGSIIAWRFNEKSSAQAKLILDSAADGIYGLDASGKVIFANPVAAHMLGLKVEDLVGRSIGHLLDPACAAASPNEKMSFPVLAPKNGVPHEKGDELFRRKDGAFLSVEYETTSIVERGEPAGTVVTFRDVTDRKRAEEAIRQSRKQYQDLVHTIDGIVWESDVSAARFTFVSDQAERILGYPIRRWIDERDFWKDHIHPDDRDRVVSYCAKATREKRTHRFEYRMRAADGRDVWLGDIATVVAENDRPVKLRGVMIDITLRREAEARARRNLKRLGALHEISMATGSTLELNDLLKILIGKVGGLLPYAAMLVLLRNRETGRLERSACFNIDEEWLRKELPDVPPLIKAAIEGRAPVASKNIQTDARTADPEFYRNHGLVSSLTIPLIVKEEVLGVLVFLTREEHEFPQEEIDFLTTLTGQAAMAIYNARLYQQMKSQAAELEAANAHIGDFTAMIAHDLRSPLHNIIAVGEMMKDGLLGAVDGEQRKWLARVVESGRGLVNLVSDFLDVSKLEAGRIELAKEWIDLKPFLTACLDDYRITAQEKKITLNEWVGASTKWIRADPRRLGQVLNNLMSNALKFTPADGRIELGAAQNGGEITLWVKDTGPGVPLEEIDQLFEKYRQTTSGKTSEQQGTGLGLVICKMIVEAHGGRIWAESPEGTGAEFFFTLPHSS